LIDILAEVEKSPNKKRTGAEVLDDLSGLGSDRWKVLAIRRIGEISDLLVRKA